MDGETSSQPAKLTRACDPCAARKIRCDRERPCRGCAALSLACTTLRKAGKPGPRGPWASKKRRARTCAVDDVHGPRERRKGRAGEKSEEAGWERQRVVVETLAGYLRTYSVELYAVWPVIDVETTLSDLEEGDPEAYAMVAALSAVTIAQLNLPVSGDGPFDSDQGLAAEAERARVELHYQERPTLSFLLSSFFLHVFSANRGQMCKATLLLREAVTFAQLLGLDDARHYANLPLQEHQLHLRTIWLLYITERGHTTRFDLPRILKLDPALPPPAVDISQPDGLRTFRSLSRLFMIFGRAMDSDKDDRTPEFFLAADAELRAETQQYLLSSRLQNADFLITQQWMRIVLWKLAMFSVVLVVESEPDRSESLSISFPERIARNISEYLDVFPREVIEAHGIGIKMKLTEVAISLADVLLCTPTASQRPQSMRISRGELLECIAVFLLSSANVGNPRLAILQDKVLDYLSTRMPLSLDFNNGPLVEIGSESDVEEAEMPMFMDKAVARV